MPELNTVGDFIRDFLAARGLPKPNGQPLYRYRIEAEEFDELGVVLTKELRVREYGHRRIGPKGAMAFCLWASEWWHRNYEKGAWKWMPLVKALGTPEFAPGGHRYAELQDLVVRGLGAWDRSVYRVGPSRRYLVTLACEGGLPMKLILREQTPLRNYLKGVLEEFKHFGATETPTRDLAERFRHRLPRALRQEPVYELAGEMIEAVWLLQHELGPTDTPVQDLDRKVPGWRDEFPVRISDDVARTLLNDLLIEAVKVARRARIDVRWNVDLAPVSNGDWELRGSFHIPATISGRAFNRLFDCWSQTQSPRRFDLGVQTPTGRFRILALGTERRTDGDGRSYRLEPFPAANNAETTGLVGPRRLLARTHSKKCPTDRFQGSSGLGEAAWVFVPRESRGSARPTCRLIGQGTVHVKESCAFVAVDAAILPEGDAGEARRIGSLRNERERIVYEVRGRVVFRAEDGSRTVVETEAASDATNGEYHLLGREERFGASTMSVFLGSPSMYLRRDGEPIARIRERHLQWKPKVPGGRWQTYSSAAVESGSIRGTGWLRYVKNDEIQHAVSICILPQGADIELLPSSDPRLGEVRLSGFGDAVAIARPTPGLEFKGQAEPGGYRLALSNVGDPPREVGIVADWHGQGRAEFLLPFPARRAVFVAADGNPMPPGASVAQGSLAGVRAEVIVPGTARFEIEGQYSGRDAAAVRPRSGKFAREIPAVSLGHYVLDLAELDHSIAERLELSDSPDAAVRLTIVSAELGDLLASTSISVSRFDVGFEHRGGEATVVGLDLRGQTISPADLDSLAVEILPLLDPDSEPIPLERCDRDAWHIPRDRLEPGPYLVLGRHGDWQRVQPMPWYFERPKETGDANSSVIATVAQAYRIASEQTHRSSDEPFGPVVMQLASDPGHPDWPLVFGYLRQTLLPVATFPLLRALVRNPVACAMAAAHASAADFRLLWERLERFPFAWWQIPLSTWEEAFEAYGEYWDKVLELIGDTERAWKLLRDETDRSIDRVAGQLEGLRAAFRFLSDRVANRTLSGKGSRIVTSERLEQLQNEYDEHRESCPALEIASHALAELRGLRREVKRVTAEHPWCASLFVKRVGPFGARRHADFADAPALTATLVVAGEQGPVELADDMRALRTNHLSWFDKALRLAQFIAFGRREAEKIAIQLRSLS
ncbi:MAG: STY4851/ECs_5259 family protein [Gammaproteobacteria bacterium]|nr:STY4851/ECs_5259 family protein [Gammaproteobacteria bacterium]